MTHTHIATGSGELAAQNAAAVAVWRIGFAPDPWAWTPWQYAENGRFPGRWDDPTGIWRTLYAGRTRLACYLEVLARFRPDPLLAADLADIREDPADAADYPTAPAGSLPLRWANLRVVGTATLSGTYVLVGNARSLPTLRARFLSLALRYGLPDLDAAAVRVAKPRALTQAIAAWIYQQSTPTGEPIAGVSFHSRHGDDQRLWAVFERAGDTDTSRHLHHRTIAPINPQDPELTQAMRIHRLRWTT